MNHYSIALISLWLFILIFQQKFMVKAIILYIYMIQILIDWFAILQVRSKLYYEKTPIQTKKQYLQYIRIVERESSWTHSALSVL